MKGYNLEAETKSKRPSPWNRTDHQQPTVQGTRKRKPSTPELPKSRTPELPNFNTASGKRKEAKQATGNEGDDNTFTTDIGIKIV